MRGKCAFVLALLLLFLTASGDGFAQKRKVKDKRYEPTTRHALVDYEGRYTGIEDSYFIEIALNSEGGLSITSYEGERQAVLKDIQVAGAIITATKVYTDGATENFAGVFANRILNGQSAFGIIVDNMQVKVAGLTLTALFYKLREESRAGMPPIVEMSASVVRREIEARHAELMSAVEGKDFAALQRLRTDDFLAWMPDGQILDSEQMAARSKAMLERIQPPVHLRNTIETLILMDNEAIVIVRQNLSSMQESAGRLRLVETSARQRETWTRTPEGWKLKFIDRIQDRQRLVDGLAETNPAGEPTVNIEIL